MTDQSAPDWILQCTAELRDFLGLGDWAITVKMVDGFEDSPSTGGRCRYQEPYRVAIIELARGRSRAEYIEFIMHELLHVVLSPMDYGAITAVRLVPKPQRKVAETLIADGCERAVAPLAKTLIRNVKFDAKYAAVELSEVAPEEMPDDDAPPAPPSPRR